ncbi:MFS transporter [Luedemannella flava]|uniref:MFS transporter n=1 Tax=Luedemannella flava TaxID=349316 RepID=A0ABN2M1A1_9ACTN
MLVDARPLRVAAYRRLWLASAVTVVFGQFNLVTVPVQLFGLTGTSATVGLAGLVTLGALAVSALWGGAVADVVDRRAMLHVTSLGIVTVAVLLWLQARLDANSVPLLLVLVAGHAALVGANATALGAAIPRVVPPDLIPAASSLGTLVRQVGAIVGPLLAGALLPVVGLRGLYLCDAVALCALVWAVRRLPPMPPAPGAARRVDVVSGFRYVARERVLVAVLAADLAMSVLGLPYALYPQVAQQTFGDPPGGGAALGLLYAAVPTGVLAGALVSGAFTRARRPGRMITLAVVAWGLAVVGFGLTRTLWLGVVLLVVGGGAIVVHSSFRNAITQTYVPDGLRGRTQGALTVVLMGGPALANAVHGAAGAWAGPTWAISGGGALAVIAMLAVARSVPVFWEYGLDSRPGVIDYRYIDSQ